VTTHDLALTEAANALDGRAINVHFEEQYEDREMQFDYRLRSGVLTQTNGANVMAALGLLLRRSSVRCASGFVQLRITRFNP
jgi:DNA mismatch repair ATPase MutS